jgi:hypothetical protein
MFPLTGIGSMGPRNPKKKKSHFCHEKAELTHSTSEGYQKCHALKNTQNWKGSTK